MLSVSALESVGLLVEDVVGLVLGLLVEDVSRDLLALGNLFRFGSVQGKLLSQSSNLGKLKVFVSRTMAKQ